ncbi:DUF998 domain-containing protein [Microtetraspora sp. AC03309]|nr:DUF998 domain-containing protein [Microtetraspora sp. AC03309]
MVLLHLLSGLNPLQDMISDYVFTPHGWLLPASLSLLALGAAAHAVRLARLDHRAALLVGGWAGCMLLVAGFPTDRPGASLSMSGEIHRCAAFVAFVCMPLAGLLVARRTGSRLVHALSLIGIGSLVLVTVPYAVRAVGLDPGAVPAGLTQRLTVVSEVAALFAMALLAGASAAAGREGVRVLRQRVGVPDLAGPGLGVELPDPHALPPVDVHGDLVLAGPVDHVGRGLAGQLDAEAPDELVGGHVVQLETRSGEDGDGTAVGRQRARRVVHDDLWRLDPGQLGPRAVVGDQRGGVVLGAELGEDALAVTAEARVDGGRGQGRALARV